MPSNPSFNFYGGSQLFLHLLTPLAAIFSFVFLEYAPKIRFRFFFMPIILALLYGIFYVVFAFTAKEGTMIDWYGFMFPADARIAPANASLFTVGTFFLFLAESLGAAVVFGLGLWVLNKIINLIFVGYTYEETPEYEDEVEEAPVKEEVVEEAPAAAAEEKPAATKKTTSKAQVNKKYKDGARVYHIARSKFVSRHWQVKLAGGEKAIKIFPTQAEAINYAKMLVRKQGGSIRIHSMKGQLRK